LEKAKPSALCCVGFDVLATFPFDGVTLNKANGEVNISHETTTMVVWIYDGI